MRNIEYLERQNREMGDILDLINKPLWNQATINQEDNITSKTEKN